VFWEELEEEKEETPHCVRGDTYWEREKDPFPTNPKRQKINFGRSWRRVRRRPLAKSARGDKRRNGGDPSSLALLGKTPEQLCQTK